MFFCNPFQETKDDGGPLSFPFRLDHEKLPWLTALTGKGEDSPGLIKSTASWSTDSCCDDDYNLSDGHSHPVFHDAVSSEACEPSRSFWNDTARRRQLISVTVMGILMVIGCWHCYSNSYHHNITLVSLLDFFNGHRISVQNIAVRIWNVLPTAAMLMEQVTLLLRQASKIDNAILSLFRWDEVDYAIVDFTKRTILYMEKRMMDVGTETVTLASSLSFTENLFRFILQTIHAPSTIQALALLDFIDADTLES